MKELVAPASNKTEAGAELTRLMPNTIVGSPEKSLHSRGSLCHVHSSVFPCCPSGSGSSAGYADSVLECWEHSFWDRHLHNVQPLHT
jgi:hypothetical protein